MKGFYKFAIRLMSFLMPLCYRIEVKGREQLPKEGGYLFVSNHRSNADPILIGIQNPETQFCFLAKQELFSQGFIGWLLKKLGAVAIDRGAGDVSALEELETRLRAGENALIFPEGTRSKDGKLMHFKTGAALIAAQTGVPVVPVGISFDGQLHFRSRILVTYGAPFSIPQTDPENPSGAVLKQIRQEMSRNVAALLPMQTESQVQEDKPAQKGE
ncbi:MAG: 1-acyl-sn-glycerol-3-phosphate acyltransferase [Oscillospiraceae bacterium]|nr:1-acyl-sn-glycerol-3-phosphate acyltransferase [Oscillospiraceae bacterium]